MKPRHTERRAVLDRLAGILNQIGSANDCQDHGSAEEAAQMRVEAEAGIREIHGQHPFVAELYPMLLSQIETRGIEGFGWSTFEDTVRREMRDMDRAVESALVEKELLALLRSRKGHFALESGHHGELWLEVERLGLQMEALVRWADVLAERLRSHRVEAVCGPLVEGAFVGVLVAAVLDVPFTYSIPEKDPEASGLYPVRYRVPVALRSDLAGKRVAVVNDLIQAGSAVRGTLEDLKACEAATVVLGALAVLGPATSGFPGRWGVPFEALTSITTRVWTPAECPLCAVKRPLSRAP